MPIKLGDWKGDELDEGKGFGSKNILLSSAQTYAEVEARRWAVGGASNKLNVQLVCAHDKNCAARLNVGLQSNNDPGIAAATNFQPLSPHPTLPHSVPVEWKCIKFVKHTCTTPINSKTAKPNNAGFYPPHAMTVSMLVPALISVAPTTIKADACIVLLEDYVVRRQPFTPSSLVPHFSLRRLSTIPNRTPHHQTEKPQPQFVRKVLAAARDLCKGSATMRSSNFRRTSSS